MAVALIAMAVPTVAGQRVERPIRENPSGYFIGMVFSPTFPEGDTFVGRRSQPSQWISTSSATGTISHLGKVSWTTEHCYQLSAGAFGTFGDAEVLITAANGDQMFGTYDGVMTGPTAFAETLIITGGTGRFMGATGTIDETGWFKPEAGYMDVTGIGSIVDDASEQASRR